VSLWLKSPKAQKFSILKPESQLFKKLIFSQVALRLRLALVEELFKKLVVSQVALRLRLALVQENK